jgi:hypothetical protein
MPGHHKRPAEVDHGDGTFSVAGIRFAKYSTKGRIYLDIPASTKVGCHCANPELWRNIIGQLSERQKVVLPQGTTHAYYSECTACKRRSTEKSANQA